MGCTLTTLGFATMIWGLCLGFSWRQQGLGITPDRPTEHLARRFFFGT